MQRKHAEAINLELDDAVLALMKGEALSDQVKKHRQIQEDPTLWPGYKRAANEKAPSAMNVGKRRTFVLQLVCRYKIRHVDWGKEVADKIGTEGDTDDNEWASDLGNI